MPDFVTLDNDQPRQLIDDQQVLAVYRAARAELATTFAGTMRWRTIAGADHLVKKIDGKETSLGQSSAHFRARPHRQPPHPAHHFLLRLRARGATFSQ